MHCAGYLNTKCWYRLASGGTSCPPRCVFPWPAWTWRPTSSRGVRAWRTWTQEPGRSPGSSLQANSSSLPIWSFPTTICTTCTLCVTTTEECTEDIIQVKCCPVKDITDFRISRESLDEIGPNESSIVKPRHEQNMSKNIPNLSRKSAFTLEPPGCVPFCACFFHHLFILIIFDALQHEQHHERLILTSCSRVDISHTIHDIGNPEISTCSYVSLDFQRLYYPCNGCISITAYCRNSVDGQWYSYDDSSVDLIPEEEVCTRGAYILFYERRNAIPPWSASCSVRGILWSHLYLVNVVPKTLPYFHHFAALSDDVYNVKC